MAKNNDVTIESSLPIVAINGLLTNKPAYFDSTVEINGALTLDSTISVAGAITTPSTVTAKNATAFTGAGTQAIGFTSVANAGIYFGSGIPTVTASTGSLYINNGGTGVASRLYVNGGGTSWIGVTTVS